MLALGSAIAFSVLSETGNTSSFFAAAISFFFYFNLATDSV